MPFYEFECRKGHVTEHLVNMDTKQVPCTTCQEIAAQPRNGMRVGAVRTEWAKRILSPTPTTFVAAGGRKL